MVMLNLLGHFLHPESVVDLKPIGELLGALARAIFFHTARIAFHPRLNFGSNFTRVRHRLEDEVTIFSGRLTANMTEVK